MYVNTNAGWPGSLSSRPCSLGDRVHNAHCCPAFKQVCNVLNHPCVRKTTRKQGKRGGEVWCLEHVRVSKFCGWCCLLSMLHPLQSTQSKALRVQGQRTRRSKLASNTNKAESYRLITRRCNIGCEECMI